MLIVIEATSISLQIKLRNEKNRLKKLEVLHELLQLQRNKEKQEHQYDFSNLHRSMRVGLLESGQKNVEQKYGLNTEVLLNKSIEEEQSRKRTFPRIKGLAQEKETPHWVANDLKAYNLQFNKMM